MPTLGTCLENAPEIAVAFWLGILCSAVLIGRHNGFGVKDTLWAIAGQRTYDRSWAIKIAIIATFLVPIALGLRVAVMCSPPA